MDSAQLLLPGIYRPLRVLLDMLRLFLRIHVQWKTKPNLSEHDLTTVKVLSSFLEGKEWY